ncbi:MAG TPA: monovalent cation:proton antiporter-2 (CPA2) family protein, partial [Methyloceanibacter sp.]|nr:monovalent cation:proton antiporter-2 (CPA2) family protein [Methyloceanibacter sp.]
MAHPLISTIVIALALAWVFGTAAHRLRLPPLVGYLLAGVLIGPATPGFVADQTLASELAEIGVILLMFGVGLHFSLEQLLSVRAIAVPGAIAQIACATLLGMALGHWLGWSLGAGLVFGLALSVASTVVLLRALQERRLVETGRGRIAVGWLIVEDMVMVLTLVLLPAFAGVLGGEGAANTDLAAVTKAAGLTIAKFAAFVAIMLIVGKRLIPWVLHYMAHTGSRELFRLAVFVIALGAAYAAAELFGVSFALGAFFAGMILSESPLSQRAAEETLPLRDAFAVIFFVSVGMLFKPAILIEDPLAVLATLAIILVGKSLAAFAIIRLFRYP